MPLPHLNVPVADVLIGGDAREAGGGQRGDGGGGAGWPDGVSLPGLAWYLCCRGSLGAVQLVQRFGIDLVE